jgi:RNA polymerase sigma factor (sigma-70 family)
MSKVSNAICIRRSHEQPERLTPGLERELVLASAAGDEAATRDLVDAFMPLIGGVARRYRSTGAVNHSELIQEGVVGLLRAVTRYDAGRETPFWAYASWWVRQAMQQLVAELASPVVLSDRALRQLARVKLAQREHLQAHGADPSCSELAAATGIDREQVEHLIIVERAPRALDEPTNHDGSATTLGELISDPSAEDEFESVVRRIEIEELRDLPADLCDREREILRARYGLGRPAETLREVAARLGLSAERVRQIEQGALAKMRECASAVDEIVEAAPQRISETDTPDLLPRPSAARKIPRPSATGDPPPAMPRTVRAVPATG